MKIVNNLFTTSVNYDIIILDKFRVPKKGGNLDMKKRLFSAFLALLMLVSSFAPLSSFGQAGDKYPYYPYLDEDGMYYRIYNSEPKPFNTDWESIVDYVATEIKACKTSVTFDYATCDESFAYICNTKVDYAYVPGADIYTALMEEVGEQIGNTGYTVGAYRVFGYQNDTDYPYGTNPRYYPFTIILSSITYENTEGLSLPCTDDNGTYYRLSNGAPLAFNTDYDEMIEYIQSRMMARRNSITYYFATTDPKYKYTKSASSDNSSEVSEKFAYDVLSDVYKKDSDKPSNAAGGDYLFKSIKNIGSHGYTTYLSDGDTPIGGNQRYYVFRITFNNICYFTTVEQEEVIKQYCQQFSTKFINSGASEYDKVKTIFDYIVRNTKYDWDVFRDRESYPASSERYTVAHSAYGAILGGIGDSNYDWSSKKTVTGLNIIKKADQGLAVCEGYAKLFYYLCVSNGIKCRIVDGDYFSDAGKPSDPHEWNYVWLDDGSGDGYKWFEVDTTFASQKSFKEVDMNDYDYFLCGRENINFGYMNHQQPFFVDEEKDIIEAHVIYDFWSEDSDTLSSQQDYQFQKINLSNVDALKNGYIVRRATEYAGDTDIKYAFLYSNSDGQYEIDVEEDGTIKTTDIRGFVYNGQPQSVYDVFVPYLDIREYDVQNKTGIKDAGTYYLTIKGASGTTAQASFTIIPMDLDNSHEGNYEDETINIQHSAVYNGKVMVPEAHIVDGYKNALQSPRDYEIFAYKDLAHTQLTEIKEIGTYYIDVNYEVGNNYSGHYYLTFNVEKVGMNQVSIDDFEFPYLPESIRAQNNISTPADLYKAGALNMKIGDHNVKVDVDYSVSSSGGLSWDESGIITLTGLSSSSVIAAGTKKTIKYNISQKYDISSLDGMYADSGSKNIYIYNGKAQKPVRFDHLDGYLDQGVDYVIDSYSNNINAGEANVKIKGINGCKGTATMHFRINKASIGNCEVDATGGVVKSITYYGKDLVKGTDYTETYNTVSGGYQIIITGINNFGGTYTINVKGTLIKPTSSGNYAKISATKYTYDGNYKKPTVTLYNGNKKAISPAFYTVSYSNNKNPGTAKATVKFQNGYSGSMVVNFTINPKGTSLSSLSAASKAFTAKWKKQATQTTGYEIQCATNTGFTKGVKTVAATSSSSTSKKITGLSKKKTYYVRIRTYKTVSGKKYYSSWSAKKSVKTK